MVEDNLTNQEIAQAVLNKANINTVSCYNGKEAILAVEEQHFDAVLMDIQMPVMDGYRLCWEVKNNEKLQNIPFIFYTATFIEEEDK